MYKKPADHKSVSASELAYINSDADERTEEAAAEGTAKISWFKLLTFRQTWAFFFGKLLTDPIWWFYLFWLPAFLKAQYGLVGTDMALPVALSRRLAWGLQKSRAGGRAEGSDTCAAPGQAV